MKIKEFWAKHKAKVATVGLVLATGVVTYYASLRGFNDTLEGYTMHVRLYRDDFTALGFPEEEVSQEEEEA